MEKASAVELTPIHIAAMPRAGRAVYVAVNRKGARSDGHSLQPHAHCASSEHLIGANRVRYVPFKR